MHLSDEARESGRSVFKSVRQPDGSVRCMAYEGGTGEMLYDFLTRADYAAFIDEACQGALELWDAHRRRAAMRLAR